MIARGEGCRVWDTTGVEYIDAASLNSTCGYGHPHLVSAAQAQLSRLHGVDISHLHHEPAGLLAERLVAHLPGGLTRTFFAHSGWEGTEAALMTAPSYWQHGGERRTRVVTFRTGYHGSTLLTRSLSGLPPTAHYLDPPLPVAHVDLPVS